MPFGLISIITMMTILEAIVLSFSHDLGPMYTHLTEEETGSEKLNCEFKVTQLASGRARTEGILTPEFTLLITLLHVRPHE